MGLERLCDDARERMNDEYKTVFEVSYFSNGSLLWSIFSLCIGVVVVIALAFTWKSGKLRPVQKIVLPCLWAPIWFIINGALLYSNLSSGKMFTTALANNQCEIVEGTVQVLHEQPYGGHDAGDHIRIGGKDFTYNYYSMALGYHQTISHGGQLKNGTMARLYYLGDEILKVEIKQ
jgi:hypothetical protein